MSSVFERDKRPSIWGVGRSITMPACGNISFWHEDFSGKNYPPDKPIFEFRIKDTNSLHYVVEGSGFFCTVNGEYNLKAGDAFFIKSGEAIKYYPDHTDPWCYCGISCDGLEVNKWLKQSELNRSCVINKEVSGKVGNIILGILEMHTNKELCDFVLNTELYRLLSLFIPKEDEKSESADYYILAALDYIRENIGDPELRIESVARVAGVSHSYLCRIIQDKTGKTAKNHMIQMRLETAARLLKNTQLSISEIVWSVGFSDPSHFCKAFKNFYGLSPSEYRKGSDEEKSE